MAALKFIWRTHCYYICRCNQYGVSHFKETGASYMSYKLPYPFCFWAFRNSCLASTFVYTLNIKTVKLAYTTPSLPPPPPTHISSNFLLTVPKRYFLRGTFCLMFCSVSLKNVSLLVIYVCIVWVNVLVKGCQLCLSSVLSWLFSCICLSFPLVASAWCGSDCISSWVRWLTFQATRIFSMIPTQVIIIKQEIEKKKQKKKKKLHYD